MIYLDNAATTQMSPEVFHAMEPYMMDRYGNAGSLYKLGTGSRTAVRKARECVARIVGAETDSIIFTSGGTESNNLAIQGVIPRLIRSGKMNIICSGVEHDSVLGTIDAIQKYGFFITYIQPGQDGTISPEKIEKSITPSTGLVCCMFVNNETGSINDIQKIASICSKKKVLFFCDCVQALGIHNLNLSKIKGISFASFSSHKIHGPTGVGALFVRDKRFLTPIINGGSAQEYGLRGGTENVAGIVGFGRACCVATLFKDEEFRKASVLKEAFLSTIIRFCGGDMERMGIHLNSSEYASPKIISIRADGVNGETLLLALDEAGICASAGSACRAHSAIPSKTLTAMGLTKEEAWSTVRFSFSRYNTEKEVCDAAINYCKIVENMRNLSKQ